MTGPLMMRKLGWTGLGLVTFVAVWTLAAMQLGPARLPSPVDVAKVFFPILSETRALANTSGFTGIAPHLLMSLLKLIIGSMIGILAGVAMGLAMSASNVMFGFFNLPVRILNAIPPLAFVPFILVWFGTQTASQVMLIAAYSFVILLTSTLEAVRHVKQPYLSFAASLGAHKFAIYKNVVFPAILPELLSSMRVALAFSWGLVIVAELVGGRYGIGRVISYMMPLLLVDQLIAVIIWIALVAIMIDWIVLKCSNKILNWS